MTKNLVNDNFDSTSKYRSAYHLETADGMVYASDYGLGTDFEISYNYGASLDFILEHELQYYASQTMNFAKYNSYIATDESNVYYYRYEGGSHKCITNLDIGGFGIVDCINDEYLLLSFFEKPRYHGESHETMHYALYDISKTKIVDKMHMY